MYLCVCVCVCVYMCVCVCVYIYILYVYIVRIFHFDFMWRKCLATMGYLLKTPSFCHFFNSIFSITGTCVLISIFNSLNSSSTTSLQIWPFNTWQVMCLSHIFLIIKLKWSTIQCISKLKWDKLQRLNNSDLFITIIIIIYARMHAFLWDCTKRNTRNALWNYYIVWLYCTNSWGK